MAVSMFKNNELLSSGKDVFSDRAFLYADGFFETMRVVRGTIPLLDFHARRVERSAESLKIKLRFDEFKNEVETCLAQCSNEQKASAVYKVIVSRGQQGRASYPSADSNTNYYSIIKVLNSQARELVSLRQVKERLPSKSRFAGLKLINRLDYSVAVQGLSFSPEEEALFLNEDDHLVEAMHHNLFFLKGETLCTPSLEGFGVDGVMRRVLIEEVAPSLDLELVQGCFQLEELLTSQGAFLSNALEGLVIVPQVDEVSLPVSPLLEKIKSSLDKLRL